jgi:hypothetical protein
MGSSIDNRGDSVVRSRFVDDAVTIAARAASWRRVRPRRPAGRVDARGGMIRFRRFSR